MTCEFVCYIQPAKNIARDFDGSEIAAWVDTGKTAVLRRSVSSKAEAVALIAEARDVAAAMGGNMIIKAISNTFCGGRRPAGVKALEGAIAA